MKMLHLDITRIMPNKETMSTEYGIIPNEEWCDKELKRIANKDFYIRVVKNEKTKYCCIARKTAPKKEREDE